MARPRFHLLCLAGCALAAIGATCARRPATTGTPDIPLGVAADTTATGMEAGVEAAVAPLAPATAGRLFGLISPHAGYMYSGAVAGYAWKLLVGRGAPPTDTAPEPREVFPPQVAGAFYPSDPTVLRAAVERYLGAASMPVSPAVEPVRTVVVMSPSHRYALTGAAVLPHDAYRTPLGLVHVDTALRQRLVELAGRDVVVDSKYFRHEHALEVQLPFMQVALPHARLLPLIVGESPTDVHQRLGAALAALRAERPDLVIVASTDMSHFLSYDEAVAVDRANLAALEALDLATFDRTGQHGQTGLCGYHPVRTALSALQVAAGAGARVVRLRYANSGDVTGERDRVVGYAALALLVADDKPAGDAASDQR